MNKFTKKLIYDNIYRMTTIKKDFNTRLVQMELIGIVEALFFEKIITLYTMLRYITLFSNIVEDKTFLRPRCDDDWQKPDKPVKVY